MSNHLHIKSRAAFDCRVDTYSTNSYTNEFGGHTFLEGQDHHVDLPNQSGNFVKLKAEWDLSGDIAYLSGINAGDHIEVGGAIGDPNSPDSPYFKVNDCPKKKWSDFADSTQPWSPANCSSS